MTPMEVLGLVEVAMAPFPHMQDKDPEPIVRSWNLLLGSLSIEVASKALIEVLQTAKHFPGPADILEAAAKLTPGEFPMPSEAWGELLKAARDIGYLGSPRWSHPAIGIAVDRTWGSWRGCCQELPAGGGSIERSQFMKVYAEVMEDQRRRRLIPDTVRGRVPGAVGGTAPLLPGDTK